MPYFSCFLGMTSVDFCSLTRLCEGGELLDRILSRYFLGQYLNISHFIAKLNCVEKLALIAEVEDMQRKMQNI